MFLNIPIGLSKLFVRSCSLYPMPLCEIKTSMIQNIAQTRCHKSKRPSNQTPNYTKPKFQSTKANNQTLNTCTLVFFGPLAMARSIWSQSSHHIRSPFYHTIVHDNDSMNEMPKVQIEGMVLDDSAMLPPSAMPLAAARRIVSWTVKFRARPIHCKAWVRRHALATP